MEAIRSLLFVPGDSERKIAKAQSSAADALILDLEDSVVPEKRAAARELCSATLQAGSAKKFFVRINALSTDDALLDLAAVVRGRPYGIMLPKCGSARDIHILDRYLSALEIREGIPPGMIKVLPIVTETGASMFGAGTYRETTPRLVGLLWGGEDLAADIGARTNRDAEGRYGPAFELARTLCLLAATAARATAVDAVYTDFRNPEGSAQKPKPRRATASPLKRQFILIKPRSSTRFSRRAAMRSPTRTAWSNYSRVARQRASSLWTAKCSIDRT